MTQWRRGTLVLWNDDRGFGFVRPDQGGKDYFVHISAFRKDAVRRPAIGDAVRYQLAVEIPDKKRIAHAVIEGVVLQPPAPPVPRPLWRAYSVLVYLLVRLPILLSCWVLWSHRNPIPLLLYVFMSTLTILFYGADKRRALGHRWRIPEFYLHLLELLGGWPGALVAQKDLRHKATKRSYLGVFWTIVALHGVAWLVLAMNDFSVRAVWDHFEDQMDSLFGWLFGVG